MGICRWFRRLALTALLLLTLPVAVLAPVSAPPTVAAAQSLSVDGSNPAASDTTCTPCKTIQGAINLAGPGNGITVAPGPYYETLTITQSVSITGGIPSLPGEQGATIVDAGGAGSAVTITNTGSTPPASMLVSLTGLTLTDGSAPGSGGGIAALAGTVSLSDTTIISNTAGGAGGGIYASNAVTLTDSPIMSNTATYAGGIYGSYDSAVMLTNSPIMSNTATYDVGGISCNCAVTLTDSPVMSNTGGGVGGGPVTLTDSPVMSNTRGGISSYGAVTLRQSPVMSNTGFGVGSGGTATLTDSPVMSNNGVGVSSGTATLTDSPVMSNTGGGIYAQSAVTLTNSPVMSNAGGSGIHAGAAVTLTDSPVVSNTATYGSGGGIYAGVNGGTATLTNSPVMSNTAYGDGGGIQVYGPVTLTDSAVMSNTAGANGGGIYGRVITLTDSPVRDNTAGVGGGIYAQHAVTLTDSPVSENTAIFAGGIAGNPVTLTRSPVSKNTAHDYGGGINGGTVTLTDSPVSENTATDGGGIYAGVNGGTVTLTDSPVMSNTATDGGGIYAYASAAVTLTDSSVSENTATDGGGGLDAQGTVALRNSAVLSNTASGGDGGILNSGSLSLTNSTLSANGAATNGGAIASTGSLTASFSTVSKNSALNGGGIAMLRSGPTTLKATILAGNTAPSGPACAGPLGVFLLPGGGLAQAGPVTSLGDNLIGDADSCSGFSAPGDLTGSGDSPLDPGLDALADNGGPTLTQALLPGSPAINHVPAARCTDASGTPVTSDQSGVGRPDPGDLSGSCDSGAYEYDGGPVILAVAPSSGPLAGGTQVVIRGTDLEGTGAVSVTFGGIAATNVITDPSGQLITATTPARAAGTVDVAVAALVETSVLTTPVTPADQFTYGVPSTPTSTAQPTPTPTATTPQGLVAISTATATPARPGATATRILASPCRRALPLRVRLSSRTARSAGTVSIRARTVSRARLSVVVRVLAHKTVVTGTGRQRRRVVRTIVLYRASATGRADARGRFQGKVHVTYKAAKQTRALLTVTTRAGCAAATATLRMTILPRRQH